MHGVVGAAHVGRHRIALKCQLYFQVMDLLVMYRYVPSLDDWYFHHYLLHEIAGYRLAGALFIYDLRWRVYTEDPGVVHRRIGVE